MANFPLIRVVLYIALAVDAFSIFCMCCARINSTDKFQFNGEFL